MARWKYRLIQITRGIQRQRKTMGIVSPVSFRYVRRFEGLLAPMQFFGMLSTFDDLQEATLVPSKTITTGLLQAIYCDDFNYTVYY